jgi:hypothetical protein
VSLTLKKALTLLNIYKGFKTIGIWLFNPIAMEGKMQPNEQFMEIETLKLTSETFNFQVEEAMGECTNSIEHIASHFYVEIEE